LQHCAMGRGLYDCSECRMRDLSTNGAFFRVKSVSLDVTTLLTT
jgi:hypothetical protein